MQKQSTTSEKGTHQPRPRRRAANEQQTTASLKADSQSAYSPEVEARRADYERLAEAFVHMVTLEMERVGAGLLDIEGPDVNVNNAHLVKALHEHLYALHIHVDWFDPRTLRKFYVEMRLWGDQMQHEIEASARKRQAEEEHHKMQSLIRSNEEVSAEARRRAVEAHDAESL